MPACGDRPFGGSNRSKTVVATFQVRSEATGFTLDFDRDTSLIDVEIACWREFHRQNPGTKVDERRLVGILFS